jgi:DNA invertase Pin-like site-specific DNA recombinase
MAKTRKMDREPGGRAVAYFPVSTPRQAGRAGSASKHSATAHHARAAGLTVSAEFVETETGTNKKNRPELAKALREAKARGAVLLITKIDRLAGNVRFVAELWRRASISSPSICPMRTGLRSTSSPPSPSTRPA